MPNSSPELPDPVVILKDQGGAQSAQAIEDDGELVHSVILRGRQLWVKRCGALSTQDGRTVPFSELLVVTVQSLCERTRCRMNFL